MEGRLWTQDGTANELAHHRGNALQLQHFTGFALTPFAGYTLGSIGGATGTGGTGASASAAATPSASMTSGVSRYACHSIWQLLNFRSTHPCDKTGALVGPPFSFYIASSAPSRTIYPTCELQMAGHSKWKKPDQALQGGHGRQTWRAIPRKLIREITMAAKLGGGDPGGNARLRTAS